MVEVIRPLNSIFCVSSSLYGNICWFNHPAALFVVFCCEGLLAFFPVLLQLLTYCKLFTAIFSVFSVVISCLHQSSN